MDKDRRIELLGRLPDNIERGVVQVPAIRAVTMLVRIDVRADLRAAQAELANASLQFARRQFRILQRNCRKPRESCRMFSNDFGDVIVRAGAKDRARPPVSPNS